MRLLFVILLGLSVPVLARAQDPFFIHFFNNESTYNPALVGYRGALSVLMKYKAQWPGLGGAHFRTGNVAVEESLPCSIFDYGLNFRFDEEGEGIFRTRDFAFRFAGVVPFDVGASRHNLRMGAGFQWSFKSVDYNRLVFSDELDPKYGLTDALGLDLPTSFVPPNDGRSLWFFSPSVGITHRILVNENKPRSATIHYGVALHNAFSLGRDEFTGNEESILQVGTKIARRWSVFGSVELLPYLQRGAFFSIKPTVLYENQGGLSYWEAGAKFSLNRLLALSAFYHDNRSPVTGRNTRWMSFALEFGEVLGKDRRFDLGFSYANSFTGLRNHVGPIFEFSVGFHFASSPSCRLGGRGDEVPYGSQIRCPSSAFSPSNRKMYESIWYKTINN